MDKLDLFQDYLSVGVNPIGINEVRFIDKGHVSITMECVINFLSFAAGSTSVEIPITLHSTSLTLSITDKDQALSSLHLSFDGDDNTKSLKAQATETIRTSITLSAHVHEIVTEAQVLKTLNNATFTIEATANDFDSTVSFTSSLCYQHSTKTLEFGKAERKPPRHYIGH